MACCTGVAGCCCCCAGVAGAAGVLDDAAAGTGVPLDDVTEVGVLAWRGGGAVVADAPVVGVLA